MRVLIDYRPALRARSGVGEYVYQVSRALARAVPTSASPRRLDLTLFSSSWKDRVEVTADLGAAAVVDRRLPVGLLNALWHRLEWPPVEALAGGPFDVVHSPHPLLLPTRSAAQVVTIHDLYFLRHPEHSRAEVRRDYPTLVRDHAHRAHRIIVPSQSTAADVERRLGVPPERIAICPHGRPDWTARRLAPEDGYILFFGTLEPRKNVGGLLDAYERLLGARSQTGPSLPELLLAGHAGADARGLLDRLAKPPFQGHVRHLGYVDPARRRALYEGARLLVQPSFDEGFGFPVLEAMTIGVPVVAANRGALPEVLGDAGLLANPEDPGQFGAAIERMLHQEGLAASCTSKGLRRAQRFDWALTAERVVEAYQMAIEQHRCASA